MIYRRHEPLTEQHRNPKISSLVIFFRCEWLKKAHNSRLFAISFSNRVRTFIHMDMAGIGFGKQNVNNERLLACNKYSNGCVALIDRFVGDKRIQEEFKCLETPSTHL